MEVLAIWIIITELPNTNMIVTFPKRVLFRGCYSWLVCLLCFLLTNAPLVKVIGNPISDGIVFKNELTHLPLLEA